MKELVTPTELNPVIGWEVHWQNISVGAVGMKQRPKPQSQFYSSREAAETQIELLRLEGVTACVVPVHVQSRIGKRPKSKQLDAFPGLPVMHKKLTK